MWKQGWTPDAWRPNYHLFLVDGDMQKRLEGTKLADLKKWFPDLTPASRGSRMQKEALTSVPSGDDELVWVGEHLEGFRLKNGRFAGVVHYDKG